MIAGLVVFSAPVQASEITPEKVLDLVNNDRKAAGVAPLEINGLLSKAAQEKANDMFSNDYFAHVSPQGKTPWNWIDKEGYDYRYAGENLAINFTNAEDEQLAWMKSPLHKKNIMNADYRETGIAVGKGTIEGHKTILVVEMFGSRVGAVGGAASIQQKTVIPANAEPTKINGGFVGYVENAGIGASTRLDNLKNISLLSRGQYLAVGWLASIVSLLAIGIVEVLSVWKRKQQVKPLFVVRSIAVHR